MERIGKYKIATKPLGQGGFSTVYLSEDKAGRVAIKVFEPRDDAVAALVTSATSDATAVLRQRFVDEARILRRLSTNPYIVNCYEFSELEDGTPYYVMPFLDKSLVDEMGKDALSPAGLSDLAPGDQPRSLALARAIQILDQLLQALKVVHEAGLVHRDIKPANILFAENGDVQLCDFGIAKLPDSEHSQTGLGMGSRHYMSDEQRESAKDVEASSDIYSVGIMAYRMITGTLPRNGQPPIIFAPEMGEALSQLIMDAMEVQPENRPVDAGEFLKRFRSAARNGNPETAANGNTMTGTWVGTDGETRLRHELTQLTHRIESILLAFGEIPESEQETLSAIASVADLDQAGLEALIERVKQQHQAQIRPLHNFRELVKSKVTRSGMGAAARKVLLAAGQTIGWDEARVNELIKTLESNEPPVEAKRSAKSQAPAGRKQKSSYLWLTLIVFVVASAAYLLFQNERQQEAGRVVEAHRLKAEKQDDAAQLEAEQINTAPNAVHTTEAQRAINELSPVQAPVAEVKADDLHEEDNAAWEEAEAKKLTPGDEFSDCHACPRMVVIPAGSFAMGSNIGDNDEKPVHRVTIGEPFALGKYEVTFDEYDTFARETKRALPSGSGWGRGTSPVINVNWKDAQAYIKWLGKQTGNHYRLPSESEWEYAARAGTTTTYSFGDSDRLLCQYGNHADISTDYFGRNTNCSDGIGKKTAQVGSYQANPFGLYDMHGNVWEWVEDCYIDSYRNVPVDGKAYSVGGCPARVLRGGSWLGISTFLRSTDRFALDPAQRRNTDGFRVARGLGIRQ